MSYLCYLKPTWRARALETSRVWNSKIVLRPSTLVPEVFLIFHCISRSCERAVKQRTWVAKRRERKISGYFELESHFHADARPRARIGWYFYRHANKLDWSVWLAIPRGRWGYLLLHLMCVYLYQRKKFACKKLQFLVYINVQDSLCSTLIWFRTVPSKEFDLCTQGAFSIDWKSQRTSKPCSQS